MSPIDSVGLKVTGLNISNRIRSNIRWIHWKTWSPDNSVQVSHLLKFCVSAFNTYVFLYILHIQWDTDLLWWRSSKLDYTSLPPWWTLSKAANSKNCTSRNKNTPIYFVIVEETFELKTTKKTRTYLLLILWHKIRVEMLYFVCFLGQLCSTSA